MANTAATVYSIVGGSSTMLEKTAHSLGKHAEICKVETYIFSKPSPFFNEYTVSGSYTITKTIFLPKPWFRVANGIGAATDATISIYNLLEEQ